MNKHATAAEAPRKFYRPHYVNGVVGSTFEADNLADLLVDANDRAANVCVPFIVFDQHFNKVAEGGYSAKKGEWLAILLSPSRVAH